MIYQPKWQFYNNVIPILMYFFMLSILQQHIPNIVTVDNNEKAAIFNNLNQWKAMLCHIANFLQYIIVS